MATRFIESVADATALAKILYKRAVGKAGIAYQESDQTIQILDPAGTDGAFIAIPTTTTNIIRGVASGYKVARGEHTQVAASDTVVTGLATVVAIVCSPRTRTVKQLFFNASPGDQAGTPAAGSILITSQKPTAVDNCTPIAATDFTDSIVVDWIAIGT